MVHFRNKRWLSGFVCLENIYVEVLVGAGHNHPALYNYLTKCFCLFFKQQVIQSIAGIGKSRMIDVDADYITFTYVQWS